MTSGGIPLDALVAVWEWLVTPLPLTLGGVVGAYLLSVVAMLAIAIPIGDTDIEAVLPRAIREHGFLPVFVVVAVIAPVGEELVFRGLPVFAAHRWGGAVASVAGAVVVGTAIWVLMHGKRWPIMVPAGVFYLKLWLAGPVGWVAAVVLHAGHNAAVLAVAALAIRLTDSEGEGETIYTPGVRFDGNGQGHITRPTLADDCPACSHSPLTLRPTDTDGMAITCPACNAVWPPLTGVTDEI